MAKQTFTTGQVLLASQLTSLQQTAMLGGAASAKTASYTLVAADAGTAISMTSTSATTITVNTGLFAAGDTVHITNLGSGVATITAGTATVNTSASLALAQYESGFLDFTTTSAAIFVKGAGAAASGGSDFVALNGAGTALSGSSTSVTGLSGYDKYYVYIYNAQASANATYSITFNSDTTSKYGGDALQLNASSSAINIVGITFTGLNGATSIALGAVSASEAINSTLLVDGGNSSGAKIVTQLVGVASAGGNSANLKTSIYTGTSVISSIQIKVSSGSLNAGTVFIYGSA
jgi:hypothetical protein